MHMLIAEILQSIAISDGQFGRLFDENHVGGIVLKELRETRIWLKLVLKTASMKTNRLTPLIEECGELMNIIGKSIVTAKTNAPVRAKRG